MLCTLAGPQLALSRPYADTADTMICQPPVQQAAEVLLPMPATALGIQSFVSTQQPVRKQIMAYLALAAAMESSPPMTSPPPGSLVISGEASRSLAASRLAIFWSILASLHGPDPAAEPEEESLPSQCQCIL